jgi:hypothetical protein
MNWQEKLSLLRELAESDPEVSQLFEMPERGTTSHFLRKLRKEFAWLPASYEAFLRYTDGAQIDTFVLAGSEQSDLLSIDSLMELWSDNTELVGCLPIGEDADGSVLFLAPSGTVRSLGTDPPAGAMDLAPSFDVFLDEMLLGPRYSELWPYGLPAGDAWQAILGKVVAGR